MGARGEVVRSTCVIADLPTPKAWLLGYVRTDVPGYREIQDGATLKVVASSAGYRFDAYVDAITAVYSAITWDSSYQSGIVLGNTPSFPDRLGWLLGVISENTAPVWDPPEFAISPAGIPLLGATWTEVTSEVERRQIVDRNRRNQGFVWGAADVFRCSLTMHRWALEALQTGWCLRGKVTLGGVSKLSTPVGLSDPDGAITGYVLGLEGVEWIDQTHTHARVTMSIATDGS